MPLEPARLLGALAGALTAFALNAQPVSDVEITADGLHRIDPSIMPMAWVRPETDLTQYTRAFVMPTVVLFRDLRAPSHSAWADSSRTTFPVSEMMQERLRETFGESFHEIAEHMSAYELSQELGRDVVMVRAYLTDVATGLPLDLAGSNVDLIRWVWEANLIVEIRDSMSDEILFRALDRQRVEGPVDADLVWGLAPRVTREWSRVMVGHIQDLSSFYPSRLYRLQQRPRDEEVD